MSRTEDLYKSLITIAGSQTSTMVASYYYARVCQMCSDIITSRDAEVASIIEAQKWLETCFCLAKRPSTCLSPTVSTYVLFLGT